MNKYLFLFSIIAIALILDIEFFIYYSSPKYSDNCLEEIASEYCESLQMSYNYLWWNMFECGKDKSLFSYNNHIFSFPEDEKNLCLIKEKFKWNYENP